IALTLFTWVLVIIWRLGWLQIVRNEHYLARAARNYTKEVNLAPARGAILDRNGKELAYTVMSDSIYVDLKLLKGERDRRQAARLLAPVLGMDEGEFYGKLKGNSSFVWIKRKVEPETAQLVRDIIEENNLAGIALKKESQRFYPNDSLAAHLLGYVGAEERGLAGLELTQEKRLEGRAGEIEFLKDGSGHPYERRETPAMNGAQLVTTIDSVLQYKVETLLAEALKTTGAQGASAVVLDPATGELLALANAPAFDPNERPKTAGDPLRQNRAISFPYEPGSIFKLVTYAAALDEGLASPEEMIDCGHGKIVLGKRIIHDTHSYGILSVADAFAKSSNVGAIKIALRLGRERLFDYISRFGFGSKTGIELPGESRGIVNPLAGWRPDSIGSVAIGQEVSITVLQAASAMAVVAHHGIWTKPHLVKRLVAGDGRIISELTPETRQVISEETAEKMKHLLEQVVTRGTGRHGVQLSGYTAAGKTGTAQKIDEKTKRYTRSKYMSSFAGFVPAGDPRFVIVVMIDEPVGQHYGGVVAAPVFNQIAEAALGDYAVPPDDERFRQALAQLEPEVRSPDSGSPKSGVQSPEPGVVSDDYSSVPAGVMPDIRGRGVRAVMRACAELNLNITLSGSGIAVKQEPAPGAKVREGDECRVEFQ
ncbi:MAG: transpeptidase family protein, partial [Blastocatellia bacterium]|nr:transpeptidase family protein [Blastocatellia bacterium]